MKRIIALLLTTLLVLGCTPLVAYANSTSDVTLIVEGSGNQGGNTDNPGDSGDGPSNPGNKPGGSGGNSGNTHEHENEKGEEAGGKDPNGNDYYLRPGISIEDSVRKNGYIVGEPNWVFNPNGDLTRAEFATIIDRIFVFEDERIVKRFEDTKGHWAEEAICRLASNEVIYGVSSREFDPDGTLTRDQALQILSRILYTDRYSTVTTKLDLRNHYAKQTLARMINAGIYEDLEKDFDITKNITRDEMIYIVNRIIYTKPYSDTDRTEKYIDRNDIYEDLLGNSSDRYYEDCLKSLDKSYLTHNFGGSL